MWIADTGAGAERSPIDLPRRDALALLPADRAGWLSSAALSTRTPGTPIDLAIAAKSRSGSARSSCAIELERVGAEAPGPRAKGSVTPERDFAFSGGDQLIPVRDTALAMVPETAVVARQPLTARPRPRRRLDERLLVRFPALLRLGGRALWRLSPSSWLRRRILAATVRTCFEAFNRHDYESAFALYHPDVETTFPSEFASVGFPARTSGRTDRIEAQRKWDADWGEFRNEPEELFDLGDLVLVTVRLTGSGLSSGLGFDRDVAYLFETKDGFAVRETMFTDRAAALEAAGLSARAEAGAQRD